LVIRVEQGWMDAARPAIARHRVISTRAIVAITKYDLKRPAKGKELETATNSD